jgi:hypothetical protein
VANSGLPHPVAKLDDRQEPVKPTERHTEIPCGIAARSRARAY